MNRAKFTKGDWSINYTGPHWNNKDLANIEINFGSDGECICDTVYEEADAHLIAVAPEMYDFIESLQLSVSDEIKRDELLSKARGESNE